MPTVKMDGDSRCQRCGVALTGQAVGELCANCLLKLALEPPGEEAPPSALLSADDGSPAAPSGIGNRKGEIGSRVRYFGDYELVEEIARGGMGVVYKARQVSLNRTVALKMILAGDFSSPAMVERFKTEAEAAARLEHPNIVPIYEIGTHEGQHYFSMRFVDGGTLTQAMAREKFSPRLTAELVVKVARAVHHAHQRGILHRDLKPGNILFDQAGEPHVADFGLAKVLEHDSSLTQSAAVMGTPSYMAPEQAAGHTKQLSTAADIYSLGAILYELLAGRVPFRGATPAETMRQVIEAEPARPRLLNSSVDRDLETVCLKCLEKDPQRRYGSAEGLAEDLERWLAQKPIVARPIGTLERTVKWTRRRPAAAALAAISCAMVAALLGIVLIRGAYKAEQRQHLLVQTALEAERQAKEAEKHARSGESRQRGIAEAALADAERAYKSEQRQHLLVQTALEAERRAKEAEKLARNGEARQREIAEAALAEAERANYFRNVTWAERDWQANNLARVEQLLDECKPELRGWEWRYLKRLCHTDLLTIKHNSSVKSVAFSPDGHFLASGTADGTVKMFSPVTGEEFFSLKITTNGIHSLVFDPIGNRLVAASGRDLFVLDTITGDSVRKTVGHSARVNAVGWSSDGKRLASGSSDKTVRIWNADGDQLFATILDHTEPVTSVAFSPDGRRLVTGSGEFARPGGRSGDVIPEVPGDTRVWDANSGELIFALGGRESVVSSVAFSPEGDFIATGRGDKSVKLWDASTGQAVLPFPKGHADGVLVVAFDPQSNRVISASADTTVRVWALGTGAELANYRGHTKEVTCLAISADGKLIASGSEDKTLKLWNAASATDTTIFNGHGVAVEFSPDGRLLAFMGSSIGEVWDLLNGAKKFSFAKSDANWGWGLAFSPDGAYFAASEGGAVGIWSTKTWEKVHTLRGHKGSVYGLAYSPDGKQLVSGSGPFRGEIKIWNTINGTEAQTLKGSTNAVWNISFSPDGKQLAAAIGSYLARGDRNVAAGRSPPGKVMIWDLTTSNVVHTLRDHQSCVWDVAFSADGRKLASCAGHYSLRSGEKAEIKIWDSQSSKEIGSLPVEADFITSISLSRDGTRLVSSAGRYKSQKPVHVSLWDLCTRKEVLSLHGHNGAVLSVTFSRDGKYLATGSEDGTVRIWSADEVTPESKTARRQALLGKESVEHAARDRTNRLEEAFRILSQRIEQSTNSLARENATRRRAAVLRQLNRASHREAGLLPSRGFHVIDLSPHYNAGLNESWHLEGSPLSSLSTGVQKLAGVDFDVWGLIQIGANASNGMAYPEQISGITVARQCEHLHFLHAAIYAASATNGARIGTYVVHYADEQRHEIPIRVGREIGDWWTHSKEAGTQFVVAWTGTNEANVKRERSIRLFKTAWKNPRPKVEIATIDFLSIRSVSPGSAAAAPFLVAITAEP